MENSFRFRGNEVLKKRRPVDFAEQNAMTHDIEIRQIYVSEAHRFAGRHGKDPLDYPMKASETVECVAGKGIVGDRYFDYKPDFKGQLTLFSEEVYLELKRRFDRSDRGSEVFRRNVIVSGVDLNTLIGQEFRIGDVVMSGVEEAKPCYWMNQAFGDGAEEALQGNGGLRVRLLTDGVLSVGSHQLVVA